MSEKYTIKIHNFEGPFDLLFHLIEKNKIDIYDIPIALITEQYIEYLEAMQEMDLEVASEFLVMAATLLHIKSRMLLPKPKTEEDGEQLDPREELVARLLEYKKYKEFTEDLKEREKINSMVFYKLPDIIEIDQQSYTPQLIGLDVIELFNAFKKVFDKKIKEKQIVNTDFSKFAYREKVSVGKKLRDIARILKNSSKISFTSLFDSSSSKIEIVATFLAILELIKLKKVIVKQDNNYSDILILKAHDQIDIQTDFE